MWKKKTAERDIIHFFLETIKIVEWHEKMKWERFVAFYKKSRERERNATKSCIKAVMESITEYTQYLVKGHTP